MNTTNVNRWDGRKILRNAEIALYGAMAILLLSTLYQSQPAMDVFRATLVYIGAMFGILAACGGTPIMSLFGLTLERAGRSPRNDAANSSNVASFTRGAKETAHKPSRTHNDDDRRVA